MHKSHIADGTAHSLPGSLTVPSGPPLGPTVVLFPFNRSAAAYPVDDATELDEDVFHIGSVAVKLVGNFKLPRIHCELVATDPAWEE